MDGVSGSGSAETTSSSSRRHAAALRLLKQSLRSNPKSIYETVESNMSDDFQNVRQLPGNAAVQVTSRGWLELRSRVQNYATPVRLLWGIAGIHDALRQGAHDEARARAALLLCQGDQLSVDRGSWVVASELGLEDAPPFASFDQHRLPSEAEPPYSKLIDPRWMELVLHRLNEFDQLTEKKKKLSKKPGGNPGRDDDPTNLKGKGGKKGKKGNQQNADDAAASTAWPDRLTALHPWRALWSRQWLLVRQPILLPRQELCPCRVLCRWRALWLLRALRLWRALCFCGALRLWRALCLEHHELHPWRGLSPRRALHSTPRRRHCQQQPLVRLLRTIQHQLPPQVWMLTTLNVKYLELELPPYRQLLCGLLWCGGFLMDRLVSWGVFSILLSLRGLTRWRSLVTPVTFGLCLCHTLEWAGVLKSKSELRGKL